MKLIAIVVLVIAAKAITFLPEQPEIFMEIEETDETHQTLLATSSPLFTEEQLAENSQEVLSTATAPESYDYAAEVEKAMKEQEVAQAELAKQYDTDLPASGNCVVIYGQCDFKGPSAKACNEPGPAFSFALPIFSVFVPHGQSFTVVDITEGDSVAFLESEKCLLQPLQMADVPKDLEFHQSGNALVGQDGEKYELMDEEVQAADAQKNDEPFVDPVPGVAVLSGQEDSVAAVEQPTEVAAEETVPAAEETVAAVEQPTEVAAEQPTEVAAEQPTEVAAEQPEVSAEDSTAPYPQVSEEAAAEAQQSESQ